MKRVIAFLAWELAFCAAITRAQTVHHSGVSLGEQRSPERTSTEPIANRLELSGMLDASPAAILDPSMPNAELDLFSVDPGQLQSHSEVEKWIQGIVRSVDRLYSQAQGELDTGNNRRPKDAIENAGKIRNRIQSIADRFEKCLPVIVELAGTQALSRDSADALKDIRFKARSLTLALRGDLALANAERLAKKLPDVAPWLTAAEIDRSGRRAAIAVRPRAGPEPRDTGLIRKRSDEPNEAPTRAAPKVSATPPGTSVMPAKSPVFGPMHALNNILLFAVTDWNKLTPVILQKGPTATVDLGRSIFTFTADQLLREDLQGIDRWTLNYNRSHGIYTLTSEFDRKATTLVLNNDQMNVVAQIIRLFESLKQQGLSPQFVPLILPASQKKNAVRKHLPITGPDILEEALFNQLKGWTADMRHIGKDEFLIDSHDPLKASIHLGGFNFRYEFDRKPNGGFDEILSWEENAFKWRLSRFHVNTQPFGFSDKYVLAIGEGNHEYLSVHGIHGIEHVRSFFEKLREKLTQP